MKINITNIEKLAGAIKEVEGRATARTITADFIVKKLNNIDIPKSKLNGTVVKYDGGEHFARAYKYCPMSTHWTAENKNGKWYVTEIFRAECPNRQKSGEIIYSETAKEYIINKASEL